MKLTPVKSKNIHAVGWEQNKLQVQFLRKGEDDEGKPAMVPGDVYEYDDVPEDLHHELVTSESVGATFALKVRKAEVPFKWRKLEPEKV
jgi:hypothetical protein